MHPVSRCLVALFVFVGCAPEEDLVDGMFTPAEWAKIEMLSPLEDPPEDPTNKYRNDEAAAALGQKFFFEDDFSGPLQIGDDGSNGAAGQVGETGKLSCASCHDGPWLIDTRSQPGNVSLGSAILPRNAASLVNSIYYFPWLENDGLIDSMWSEGMIDVEFNLSFNSNRLRLAHVIYANHRDDYNAVFDPDLDPALDPAHPDAGRFPADAAVGSPEWEAMTPADQDIVTQIYVHWGKAMDAYMLKLVSKDAPFDRYVAGDTSAIDAAAKRGLKLFAGKAGCIECHNTPHFSDDDFHNTGIAAAGPNVTTESGRLAGAAFVLAYEFNSSSKWSDDRNTGRLDEVTEDESLRGAWRTKGLRQIAETAPYMHTGQFKDLREVVRFYNEGGHVDGIVGTKSELMVPLNLSDAEIDDIVAFLGTLTGEPVPAALLARP
jgi:cytochrome c peroxidase